MKVGIITSPCLAMTHGTGAQILRFFETSGVPFFHLYWDSKAFGLSEYPASYLMESEPWPWYRGRRFFHKVGGILGLRWWQEDSVHPQKFRRFVRQRHLRCDVAYVVVAREAEAKRANSLLRVLNCPYVVHLMDLDHDDGLDPDTMPHYRKLLHGAASVLVLNDGLRQEAAKFQISDLQTVTFGREVTPLLIRWETPEQPVRVLITGNIEMHQEGLDLLAHAWAIPSGKRSFEIIYSGANSKALPASLAGIVTDLGYVSSDEYQKMLSTCQLAFLPGPMSLNTIGRFSVPSRLSDYLMNGLPVVACLAAGSAAEVMLAPLIPEAVRVARTPEQIWQAISDFSSSPAAWGRASRQAREFAVSRLSVASVRAQVLQALSGAAALGNAASS